MTEACDKYSHPSFPTFSISGGIFVLKSLLFFLNNQCWMEPFQFTQHVAKWHKLFNNNHSQKTPGLLCYFAHPFSRNCHTPYINRNKDWSNFSLFTLRTDAKALGQYQWTVWDQKEVGFTPKQKMDAQRWLSSPTTQNENCERNYIFN